MFVRNHGMFVPEFGFGTPQSYILDHSIHSLEMLNEENVLRIIFVCGCSSVAQMFGYGKLSFLSFFLVFLSYVLARSACRSRGPPKGGGTQVPSFHLLLHFLPPGKRSRGLERTGFGMSLLVTEAFLCGVREKHTSIRSLPHFARA